MTRNTKILLTMCLALATSLALYSSFTHEGAQEDRRGSDQTTNEFSTTTQDKDAPESAATRETDARASSTTAGEAVSDITAALRGSSGPIEEFITGNGSSFKLRELTELLSDENFPRFVTAMGIGNTPVEQQNLELAVSNTLFSHPLVVNGSVVPRSTNCGKRFCVSVTAAWFVSTAIRPRHDQTISVSE